ncbi:peptidase M20 [Bacillaceae bacterium JMAK1]|nr:peptidase M20 [Bacillaceae bacterium JMAK1]
MERWLNELEPKLIAWRRHFHKYPEVGWTEYVTTAKIVEELERLGFTLYIGKDAVDSSSRSGVPNVEQLEEAELRAKEHNVPKALIEKMSGGHTGVVARLDTGRKGPHTALRFDIDALPIFEATEDHLPKAEGFQSIHDGFMHACGHDGHTSIGLGVAHYLYSHQDELSGEFTLLFQPAEEGSRGAKAMVGKGWLNDVDNFLSGHIGISDEEVGLVAATTEGFLATTKFDMTFKGKASHAGAKPEEGKNALLSAANFSQHAYAIPRHSAGDTRVNIGTLEAGSGRNVTADHAFLRGESRGETEALDRYMFEQIKQIAQASADLYGTTVEIEEVGQGTTAECDNVWIDRLEDVAQKYDTINKVLPKLSIGASEDVTHMMRAVKEDGGEVTYMIFGTPLKEGHHHPQFDYDENVLRVGVLAVTGLIERLHCKD